MKRAESIEFLDEVWHHFCKKGMPVNIKTGLNMDIADYIRDEVAKCVKIDEPIGVEQGFDFDHCPACHSVVGQSAYWCKHCGNYLRASKDWG